MGDLGKRSSLGAIHREGSRGRVFRSVFVDGPAPFGQGCLDIDDALPSELQYRDVVMDCSNGALAECDDGY